MSFAVSEPRVVPKDRQALAGHMSDFKLELAVRSISHFIPIPIKVPR